MRIRTVLAVGLAWSLGGIVSPALAQQPSLAEVARQEAARRKTVETSKKVYTNKDVDKGRAVTTGAATKPATAATAPATPGAAQAADAATAAAAPGAPAAADPQLARLRSGLALLTSAAADAMSAIEKSNAVLLALSDEHQRNAATSARETRLVELRRLQAEIEALTQQIDEASAGGRAPDKGQQQ